MNYAPGVPGDEARPRPLLVLLSLHATEEAAVRAGLESGYPRERLFVCAEPTLYVDSPPWSLRLMYDRHLSVITKGS